jgi:hypothetical protein
LNALAADSTIWSICSDAAGNIYAAGTFTNPGGGKYVAKWNGTAWSEVGGLNALAANDWIMSICSDTLGNIYAAGYFTNSGGKKYVAKWNGTAWSEAGGLNGLAANDAILSIYKDATGNIYAAGFFTNPSGNHYVAKWNGTAWSELGGLNGLAANGLINSVYCDKAGNIYAGGSFTNSSFNNYLAEYASSTGINPVTPTEPPNIFPNPTTGNFTITFPDIVYNVSVVIENVLGERIFSETVDHTSKKEINLKNISPGIYYVKVMDGEKHSCVKIIVR